MNRTLAMIHGCTGPVFFAFTAALAAVSSRRWRAIAARSTNGGTTGLLLMTIATPILAYLQIILGAQVRHIAPDAARKRFRCLSSFTSPSVWLVDSNYRGGGCVFAFAIRNENQCSAGIGILWAGYVTSGSWVRHVDREIRLAGDFIQRQNPWRSPSSAKLVARQITTTAHVAVGSLIFALATVQAVFGVRQWWPQLQKSRTIRGSTVERSQSLLLEAAR